MAAQIFSRGHRMGFINLRWTCTSGLHIRDWPLSTADLQELRAFYDGHVPTRDLNRTDADVPQALLTLWRALEAEMGHALSVRLKCPNSVEREVLLLGVAPWELEVVELAVPKQEDESGTVLKQAVPAGQLVWLSGAWHEEWICSQPWADPVFQFCYTAE